jgi:outer membrane lipoprotein-sorting protein
MCFYIKKMIGINSSILQYLDEKYERLQMVSAHYKKLLCNALDAKKKYRHMIETIKKKHRQKIIYYRQEIQR